MRAAFYVSLAGNVLCFWLSLVLFLTASMKSDDRYAAAGFVVSLMGLAFIALAALAARGEGDDDGPATA